MTEAVLLVGGRGTRLRPLTVEHAKPMLPAAGVPFLAHPIARLAAAGVTRVVLATGYRAETFAAGLGDGSAYGVEIDYVTETVALGTGGGLRNVADRLASAPDEPVLVVNGDVLSGHDIAAQVAHHRDAGADATLHLVEADDPRAFGCCPTDETGRITAFLEKTPNPVASTINAGCYVLRRRVIDEIPAGRPVSIERETFPALLERGSGVQAYADSSYWLDVGTPGAFIRASCDLVLGRVASPALPAPAGDWIALDGALVAADALLSGGTVVGPGARVGAGAVVEGSVLFAGAVVEDGAIVRHSAVAAGARVGARSVLEGVVVGDRADIGAGNELFPGVRVWCDAVLPPASIRFSSDIA
jgi:mannose-1-phosphate guanylyltransferase